MKLCPKFLRLKKREYALLQKKRLIEVQLDAVYRELGYFKPDKGDGDNVQL
jgi:hypothetical protein